MFKVKGTYENSFNKAKTSGESAFMKIWLSREYGYLFEGAFYFVSKSGSFCCAYDDSSIQAVESACTFVLCPWMQQRMDDFSCLRHEGEVV